MYDSPLEIQANITSLIINAESKNVDLINNKDNMFIACHIHSTLFSHLMRMSLVLNDSSDFVKNLKLVGNEEVIITLSKSQSDKLYTLKFRINSIVHDRVKNVYDKKGQIILDCVSEEYLTGSYVLSKKLSGTSNSILSGIVTNNLGSNKILSIDSYSYNYEIQTNYKNSFSIINYLEKNDDSFFWEDINGFNYRKFSWLGTTGNEKMNFYVNQQQLGGIDVPRAYKLESFNNEILLAKGVIHSDCLNIPTTRYTVNKNVSKNSNSVSDSLGNTGFFNKLESKKSGMFNEYGRIDNRMKRFFQVYNMNSNVIQIKTNANFDRRVGQKMFLDFHGHDNTENHDSYKGNWLITAIKHEIIQGGYTQDIKLAKINYEK